MTHRNVYDLIARTSRVLSKNVNSLGSNPKWPKSVTEIQENLSFVNDKEGTIQVMVNFINKYERRTN